MSSTASAVLQPHVERFWGTQRLEISQGRRLFSEALNVRHVDGGARIELRPGFDVSVRGPNGVSSLKDLQRADRLSESALVLQVDEIAEISDGLTRWTVQFKATTSAPRVTLSEQVDVRLFKTVAMVILLALALIAVMQMPRVEEEGAMTFGPAISAHVLAAVEVPKPPQPKLIDKVDAVAVSNAQANQIANAPRATPKKLTAKEALLHLMGGPSLFDGDHGLGDAVNNALNNLSPGNGHQASGGDGLAGAGPRGNGVGIGPGGMGNIGDVGALRGPAVHGIPLGNGHKLTVVPVGPPTIEGGLDHDVVRKVIERHQSEIKFCYESELHKDASLAGKVAVQFTIDGTGVVSTAAVAENSMNNEAVQSCILSRVQRWKFPEPKGGGIVSVTYPWLFKSAGDE